MSRELPLLSKPAKCYVGLVRVVFCIHELALNGAVTALLQQVRRMSARGDTVTILAPTLVGASAALEAAFRAAGATITNNLIVSEHDVAVGCSVFAAETLEQLVGLIPTVWWIHEGRAGVNVLLALPSGKDLLWRVNKLIFASRGVVERVWTMLLADLPPGRIDVIPYLVPPPGPGMAVERRPGHTRVVCVGTIYPRKRQSDLVQAVSMLHGDAVECALIGERIALEPPADQLIAANPGRFVLTGGLQPETVQAWYRSSDIFALPSGDECMPIAPIEAAWHGIPVILADLECYEGIWRHGHNALLHPVGDVEMLAWYLRMLMESPRIQARLTTAARSIALQFTEQRVGALFDAALLEASAAPI